MPQKIKTSKGQVRVTLNCMVTEFTKARIEAIANASGISQGQVVDIQFRQSYKGETKWKKPT